MIRCYEYPAWPIPIKIIKIGGNYYSFMQTIRTFRSIYEEVKNKVDTLIKIGNNINQSELVELINELEDYCFVEEFEEN